MNAGEQWLRHTSRPDVGPPRAVTVACLPVLSPKGKATSSKRGLCLTRSTVQGTRFKCMATTEACLDPRVMQKPQRKLLCRQKTLVIINQFDMDLSMPDIILFDGDLELK